MAPVMTSARRLQTLWIALVAGSLALSGWVRANDLLERYAVIDASNTTNLLVLKQQAGELTDRDLAKVDDLLVERAP